MGQRPELFKVAKRVNKINSGYYEYFKNINSGYCEWLSGAWEYVSAESVLLREWCMRVMHESMWVMQRMRYYLSGVWEYVVVHE